jgi:ubiquinone/menaquinone biosynthesis C-methylase UbiE
VITPPKIDPTEEARQWSDALAPAWERYRDRMFASHRRVSEWLVGQIDPQPGQTILELAAGPGETGFLVAQRLGPEGALISTDFASGMVDAARRGAQSRGLQNVEHRVMDAEEIDIADACVDGVLCRFGFMLMAHPSEAFREARRVLCPGGRLAYAVWGPPETNRWMTILGKAMTIAGHEAPGDSFSNGGPFCLSTAGRNRDVLAAAGFHDVKVEELLDFVHFDDFEDYWAVQSRVSGPMGAYLSHVPTDEAEKIRDALRPLMTAFESHGGYEFPSLVLGVSAT